MFSLIDGSNFYANCEKVFRPSLEGIPVVVLSSNDGCAIARSNEARNLGIKMGQPWHEIRHFEEEAGLIGLSANFELYGDMSDRMMSLAAGMGPVQEIYSIDESFIGLSGVRGDLRERALRVRERILQWIGIPCCIGIGPTKTLAKLANHVAKTAERKPGSYPAHLALACDLTQLSKPEFDAVLGATEVGDVWGVGRRIGAQLVAAGVHTALDLARADPSTIRRAWSVVLERTVRELQGTPCIELEHAPAPKKEIACTRSFGKPVEALGPLLEAVSEFASRAARKLREQNGLAAHVLVFVRTSPFRKGPQFSRSFVMPLRRPTAVTSEIVGAAAAGLRTIYKPGFMLAKAGVMLLDIQPASVVQTELDLEETASHRDRACLMHALDRINDRWGRGTLKIGSGPIGAAPCAWATRQERKTPAYTTDWNAMPMVRT